MTSYFAHEIAEAFPLIEGERFAELVTSIRQFGLQNEIILFEGRILDGRNRYRACLEAGIEPEFVEFSGTREEALEHVRIHNLHRRDLSISQRAMAAARLMELNGQSVNTATLDKVARAHGISCLLYTSPSPRDS